jgi:hypothetical protein
MAAMGQFISSGGRQPQAIEVKLLAVPGMGKMNGWNVALWVESKGRAFQRFTQAFEVNQMDVLLKQR